MTTIHAYQKYGVRQSILYWLMKNSPTIDTYQDCLVKYFRLYWEGKYLITRIFEGCIIKDDTTYVVVYDRKCTRGYIVANPNKQYSVSFRKASPEFNLPAYCFVSNPEVPF